MKSIATRLTNKLSVLMLPCVITILLSSCGSKPLAFEANDDKSNTPEASSVPSELLIGKWSDKNDENFINKAYESIATATEQKNVNQMFAYASPEYKSTDTNGKVKNLQENVQKESAGFQAINMLGSSTIKSIFKIESIKSDEQNVVVLVNEKVNLSISSQSNPITSESKHQDTWVRTSNGLKMIASQDISSNVISAKPNLQTNQANQAQVSDNQSSTPEASSAPSEIIGNWSNKKIKSQSSPINN